MARHIFINSHDLDTSMIGAQLTGGKGRFTDIEGTCFGYKFEFSQIQREKMPEAIRSKIPDNWLDAQSLIKYDSDLNLINSGITAEDADMLNSMPDGTYFWHTRHVSEMFMNIDKIENAKIIQLVASGWEPYMKLLLNYYIFEKGSEFTDSINTMLDELADLLKSTNRCATGLYEDGYDVIFCDYKTMFNAELFKNKIGTSIGIDIDAVRNQKIINDYLEENLGAISFAKDDEISNFDWSAKYKDKWTDIISPVIGLEMKRSFLSDKKYFTEPNNTKVRSVEDYDPDKSRDWFDDMVITMKQDLDAEDDDNNYLTGMPPLDSKFSS